MSRDYFGLSALERCTQAGGSLSVHIGDALSPSVAVQGGFAGKTFYPCKAFLLYFEPMFSVSTVTILIGQHKLAIVNN